MTDLTREQCQDPSKVPSENKDVSGSGCPESPFPLGKLEDLLGPTGSKAGDGEVVGGGMQPFELECRTGSSLSEKGSSKD